MDFSCVPTTSLSVGYTRGQNSLRRYRSRSRHNWSCALKVEKLEDYDDGRRKRENR